MECCIITIIDWVFFIKFEQTQLICIICKNMYIYLNLPCFSEHSWTVNLQLRCLMILAYRLIAKTRNQDFRNICVSVMWVRENLSWRFQYAKKRLQSLIKIGFPPPWQRFLRDDEDLINLILLFFLIHAVDPCWLASSRWRSSVS